MAQKTQNFNPGVPLHYPPTVLKHIQRRNVQTSRETSGGKRENYRRGTTNHQFYASVDRGDRDGS